MAGIDAQIAQRMALGPQALQQRYAQTQQLVDLLALQKLSKDKADAAKAIQAQMQTNPASVKDQLEQQLVAAEKQEVGRDIASMIPGVQQQGRQMAMAQQRPPMPQGQGGLPQLASPNMASMAGGGIVAFQEGGDVDAANEYIRLTEKLKDPNITPEAAQAITMMLEDMKRQAQDESRFMLEVERASGFDPAAEYERSMQEQGGMYGGGEVQRYQTGDLVTTTDDSEMYAIEDVLGIINSEARNAGQRGVGIDGQGNPITAEKLEKIKGLSEKRTEYENPRSNYRVRNLPKDEPQPAQDIGNVDDAVQALLDSMRPRGKREEREEKDSTPRMSRQQAQSAEAEMYGQMNAQSQAQALENMVNRGVDEADANARRSNANMDTSVSYSVPPVRPRAVSGQRSEEDIIPRPTQETSSRQGMQNAEAAMYAQLAGQESQEDVDTGTPVEFVEEGDLAGDLIEKTTSFIQKEWEEDPMGVIATAMMLIPVGGWAAGTTAKIAGPIIKKYGPRLGNRIIQTLKKTYTKQNPSRLPVRGPGGRMQKAPERVFSPGRAAFTGGAGYMGIQQLSENSDGIMSLLGGNGESETAPTTAPTTTTATAPEQDIVDAMINEGIIAPESVPTGREAFLGDEDAARQDMVDAEVRKGREIDWDLLREMGAGMAGQTSIGGALGAGAGAVGQELRRREGVKAEESRFARDIEAKKDIAQQQLDMFKDELTFKRDQLATTQEKQNFDRAVAVFNQTWPAERERWIEEQDTWMPFDAASQAEIQEHMNDWFNAKLAQYNVSGNSPPSGQSGLTPEQARANEILGI